MWTTSFTDGCSLTGGLLPVGGGRRSSCHPLPDAPADDVLHVLEVHAVFLGELRLGDASGLPAGTDLAHLLGRQLGAAWRPVLDRLRCEGEVEVRSGPAHVVVRVDEGDDLAFGLRCAPGLVEEVLGFGEETVDVTHRCPP